MRHTSNPILKHGSATPLKNIPTVRTSYRTSYRNLPPSQFPVDLFSTMQQYQPLQHFTAAENQCIINHMSMPAQNLSLPYMVLEEKSHLLNIIEDALSDPHSPALDTDHPHHREAVQALRRLQLHLMDPSNPIISELDLRRLNLSRHKAEQLKDNVRFYGTAIGNRPKMLTEFVGWDECTGKPIYRQISKERYLEREADEEVCEVCRLVLEECECEFE